LHAFGDCFGACPMTEPAGIAEAATVLKTPHIALLCLNTLDLLEIDYEVMGEVGQCCGVYQQRAGDLIVNNKVAYATIEDRRRPGGNRAFLVPVMPDLDR
jgi:hypothetical protein